jgi:hypothetical protein
MFRSILEIRKDKFLKRSVLTICVLVIGIHSARSGFILGAISALCFLGSWTLLPRRNALVYWPVGLLATLLVLYGAYFLIYFLGIDGITPKRAIVTCCIAMISMSVISIFRSFRLDFFNDVQERHHWSAQLLMMGSAGFVLAIGIYHFYYDKTGMIAGFLSGGDHGIHLEYMRDLVNETGFVNYSSPFSLQSYAKGIHFLLGNLLLIGQSSSTDSLLVQRHLVPALFEYIQLAAFLQLVIIVATKIKVRNELLRTFLVAGGLFAAASIPKLGHHLFWSGFTTSLALSWILLIPLAVSWDDFKPKLLKHDFVVRIFFWSLMAISIWIVYQPYVVIPFACIAVEFLIAVIKKCQARASTTNPSNTIFFKTVLVITGITVVSFLPYFLQGKGSQSLQRLVLYGVSWRIGQLQLVAAALLAALFLAMGIRRKKTIEMSADAYILWGVVSFSAVMTSLAALVSVDFTINDPPYYVQKTYWAAFFVSLVVLLKWVPVVFDLMLRRRPSQLTVGVLSVLGLSLFSLPILMGSSPTESSKHIAIDWFAQDMFVDMSDVVPYRASVFNTWENLGAHVGNIALREDSSAFLPIDIAQSRNSTLACWYMRDVEANIIFTATGQSLELVKSGCDQFANYVESGTRVGPLILPSPEMVIGRTVEFASEKDGSSFLASGFSPLTNSGAWSGAAWADGFHSSIQMRPITPVTNGEIEFVLFQQAGEIRPISVEMFVNGVRKNSTKISPLLTRLKIDLPRLMTNDVVSFQFVCSRTFNEVLETENNLKNRNCIGVRSYLITES